MIRTFTHGQAGPPVFVLHGGPAAAGCAVGLARGLADEFTVYEPWQRGSDEEPLTVARHVADLHALVTSRCPGQRPALVGESWGAMLALAYAAAYPDEAGPLALVGCGTWDPETRALIPQTIAARTTPELQAQLDALERTVADPGERMVRQHELCGRIYDYDPLPEDPPEEPPPPFDQRAHVETWEDMLGQQALGVYPASFGAIRSPVLMLHGAYDPHPGPRIRDSLLPWLPHLTYREWERCGHSPWRERWVRDEFFAVLRAWLAEHQSC